MNNFGKAIVYPKRPKLVDAKTSQFKFRPIRIDQIPTKQLPWTKNEWNIFVSTIKSINDVRGFLYAEDDKVRKNTVNFIKVREEEKEKELHSKKTTDDF